MFRTFLCLSLGSMLAIASVAYGQKSASSSGDSASLQAYTQAAKEQFARGERAMQKRDYEMARKFYKSVARKFPFSRFAPEAELRIADSYFKAKMFTSAAQAYKSFSRLRPRNKKVPYADYQVVRCYQKEMPKQRFFAPPVYERDLTDALLAYQEARRYLIRYKNGTYFDEVAEILQEVADRLADHEIYVAKYYERRDDYIAAMRRYHYLVTSFPESDRVPAALLSMAKSAEHIHRLDKIQWTAHKQSLDYPNADEHDEIQAILARAQAYAQAHPDAGKKSEGDEENATKNKNRLHPGSMPNRQRQRQLRSPGSTTPGFGLGGPR